MRLSLGGCAMQSWVRELSTVPLQKPSSPGGKRGRYLGRNQRKLNSFGGSSSSVVGGGGL